MPDLGKATYQLIFDTREGEAAVSTMEARAAQASRKIAESLGVAEKSMQSLDAETKVAAVDINTSTHEMTVGYEEAGAAATHMGEEAAAGSEAAGLGAEKGAAKTAFAWDKAGKKMSSIGRKMRSIGRGMTQKVTLPVAFLGGLAVKKAFDYTEQIRMLQTQAGATGKEVTFMNDAVLKLAKSGQVTHTPNELAKALYHLESSGIRGKAAMEALTQADHLATVGHANLEQSTDAVAHAFSSGVKGAQNFKTAVGIVNATIGAGNMRLEDFNQAMSTGIFQTARSAGVSLQELGAALATFTTAGLPAVQSMTALRMALTQLQNPTTQQKKAMKQLGFEQHELAHRIRTQGLVPTIQLVQKRYAQLVKQFGKENANQILLRAFGGAKSGKAMLGLVQNVGRFGKNFDQINRKTASFGSMVKKAMDEPVNKMRANFAKISASFINLGNKLIPFVTKLVEAISRLFDWFDKLSPKTQKWILIAIGIAAALGPVLSIIGLIVGAAPAFVALGGAIAAIGAPVILVALAVALLYIKFKLVRTIVNAVVTYLIKRVFHLVQFIWNVAKTLPGLFVHPWQTIKQLFRLGVSYILSCFTDLPGGVKRVMGDVVNVVIDAINWISGKINGFIHSIPTGFKASLKHGIQLKHGFGKNTIPEIPHVGWGKKGPAPKGALRGAAHTGAATTTHRKAPPKKTRDTRGAGTTLPLPDTWTPPANDLTMGGGGGGGTGSKKKKGRGSVLSGGILGPEWMKLQNAYLAAQRTKTLRDDRKALDNEEMFLKRMLKQRQLSAKKKNAILKELLKIDKERLKLTKKAKATEGAIQKEAQAVLETRGTFFSQFAGDIFGTTSSGLTIGGETGAGHKSTTINQQNHYNEIPKNRYAAARAMQKAASSAMDGF